MDRLDKILVSQNIGSRKEVQKLIRQKSVTVNGEVVTKPDLKVDAENSTITVCGNKLDFKKYVYIMMHKPQGVVSASRDKKAETVLDLLPDEMRRSNLFPAGRLDKDTEGLLLITDDGDFAHKILSPKSKVYKRYYAELDGEVTKEVAEAFAKGIVFADGTECLPAKLEIAGNSSAYVEICEGKFHQVKKMFLTCGLNVEYLKRLSIGSLELDGNLPIGSSKYLEKTDIDRIFISK